MCCKTVFSGASETCHAGTCCCQFAARACVMPCRLQWAEAASPSRPQLPDKSAGPLRHQSAATPPQRPSSAPTAHGLPSSSAAAHTHASLPLSDQPQALDSQPQDAPDSTSRVNHKSTNRVPSVSQPGSQGFASSTASSEPPPASSHALPSASARPLQLTLQVSEASSSVQAILSPAAAQTAGAGPPAAGTKETGQSQAQAGASGGAAPDAQTAGPASSAASPSGAGLTDGVDGLRQLLAAERKGTASLMGKEHHRTLSIHF